MYKETTLSAADTRGADYLTIAEVARRTHRTRWVIWKAIQDGELTAFQPGGRGPLLIRPADLRAYVEA